MANGQVLQANILSFPGSKTGPQKARKSGLNRNRDGSVRKVNGKVYVDFIYLGERVREPSGLDWNEKNSKTVREQLDRIVSAIQSGTFRYSEVFPDSNKREYFTGKERGVYGLKMAPEQVVCKDFFAVWYDLLGTTGRVTGRTLLGYRSYMNLYLIPFFGHLSFSDLSASTFDRFVDWARQQQYLGK
jgi:integrase